MEFNAFYPSGNTVMINLTSASTGGVQPSTGGLQAYQICNISTGNIFVGMSQSSLNTAVLPLSSVGSTVVTSFPISPARSEVFTGPPNAWFSAITTAASLTAIMAVTAGLGKK